LWSELLAPLVNMIKDGYWWPFDLSFKLIIFIFHSDHLDLWSFIRVFSHLMTSLENIWQEIRDHSSIQNLSRSFTVYFQIHVGASPLQFSPLVFFRIQVRDWGGILCWVTHFCVDFDVCYGLLSWWKIQTRPIIRFLAEPVRFWFFICWYWLESMIILMYLMGPPTEKQAHNIKDPAVYLTVGMGYFLSLCTPNTAGGFAAKKAIF